MAESTFWKNNLQGSVQLLDGTGTPVTLTLSTDRGDLKLTNLSAKLNAPVIQQRRGKFGSLNRGERLFVGVSLSCWVGNIVGSSSSAPGTPFEFVNKLGAYSANVSTLGASREYTFDLKYTIEGTNFGDAADETVTVEDVVATCEWQEAVDGTYFTLTGQGLGAVVHGNSTNTPTMAQYS